MKLPRAPRPFSSAHQPAPHAPARAGRRSVAQVLVLLERYFSWWGHRWFFAAFGFLLAPSLFPSESD